MKESCAVYNGPAHTRMITQAFFNGLTNPACYKISRKHFAKPSSFSNVSAFEDIDRKLKSQSEKRCPITYRKIIWTATRVILCFKMKPKNISEAQSVHWIPAGEAAVFSGVLRHIKTPSNVLRCEDPSFSQEVTQEQRPASWRLEQASWTLVCTQSIHTHWRTNLLQSVFVH